ncbi:MAG: hypothetical protein IJ785_04165 [Bacteroidales bacterium]|nr:hypothetical protein [Bacteroidales bacterium]
MEKKLLFSILTVIVLTLTGCKSTQKQIEVKAPISTQTEVAVYDVPCWMADDDQWFYATIQRQFKQSSMNTAATATLRSAQMLMRQKLSSVYRAVLRDYFDQMDIEEGSYANQHLESAGDLVIKATINETYEVCRKQTRPDENGNVTMFMTIKVSKKKFANDLVQKISDDEQLKVRFNEKTFRDSAFKVFEESNKKDFNEFKEQ